MELDGLVSHRFISKRTHHLSDLMGHCLLKEGLGGDAGRFYAADSKLSVLQGTSVLGSVTSFSVP